MNIGRPLGGRTRSLQIGLKLTLGLLQGRRYTVARIAAEHDITTRTAYRWLRDMRDILPLSSVQDGDGATVFTYRVSIGGNHGKNLLYLPSHPAKDL